MKTRFTRVALLGFALAPMMALAPLTGALAADESDKTAEATVAITHAMPMMPPMPKMNYDGGTAIINFIARVDDATMAELASAAQNAVLGGAEAIRINISSPGGTVSSIQFAVNVLTNLPVPVETAAMSEIASAAVALFCVGEKRTMADGSAIYLHQQRGYGEIQDKTAAAVLRSHRISARWYEDLMHDCVHDDADRSLINYSSRDVVIDKAQATDLGMVTAPLSDMTMTKVWGPVRNILAAEKPAGFGYHRRSEN